MPKTTSRQDGRPAMLFYPGDWQREPSLGLCSLAARGLWIDMLCLMFFAEKRGLLQANGKQMESTQLAILVRTDEVTVNGLVTELETAGVFSRLDDGTIYSRRMRRDSLLSEIRSDAGKKGGRPRSEKQKESKVEGTRESKPKARHEDEHENANESEHEIESESEQVINAWNIMAATCGLPKIEMGSSRRVKDMKAKARIRLADSWWHDNWQTAMAEVVKRPFLCGENERGWKANLDWFLRTDSVAKIAEGMYDNQPAGQSGYDSTIRTIGAGEEP